MTNSTEATDEEKGRAILSDLRAAFSAGTVKIPDGSAGKPLRISPQQSDAEIAEQVRNALKTANGEVIHVAEWVWVRDELADI